MEKRDQWGRPRPVTITAPVSAHPTDPLDSTGASTRALSSGETAGVVSAGKPPLSGLLSWVNRTLAFRPDVGQPLLGMGYYANVLRIADNLGLAISTDGVGTKILVAEMMRSLRHPASTWTP